MRNASTSQRGVSMIEALVAFLILSMGLLAFARIQLQLRYGADVSRQRSEAVRLAQENMEQLRAFTTIATTAGQTSYDGSMGALSSQALTQANANTSFTISRTVTTVTDPNYKSLVVNVNWTDRQNTAQTVRLNSVIAGIDPALQGQMAVPSSTSPVKNPLDRNVRIPISAVDLGNRRSGFTPPGQNAFFWVFDSDSAAILQKCAFPSGSSTLNADAYANASTNSLCTSRPGYLLKGFIRFDLGRRPDSKIPGSTSCDFYRRMISVSGSGCSGASNPTDLLNFTMDPDAGYTPGGGQPKSECYDDFTTAVPLGRSYVNYYCAIYVRNAGDGWSGNSLLSNTAAWSFGTTTGAAVFRNCRYSADYNNSGGIDSWEHPYRYSDVKETLTSQNFLIVDSHEACPTGIDEIGNTGVNVNYQTCRHQPDPGSSTCTP